MALGEEMSIMIKNELKALSNKAGGITPSATLEITAKAKELKEAGEKIISFSVGEPDFQTPRPIRDAAIDAIENGSIGYTAASGMPALKKAIVKKLYEDQGVSYKEESIVVSSGAKHSLFNVLQALCEDGDEVLLPTPYWVSYPELIKMAGAKAVLVPLSAHNDYAFSLDVLEGLVTDKTKAIMLNSPNNPTGKVYDQEMLTLIGDFAVKHNLYVISDEIYEKLIYDTKHISIASINEAFKERTIIINGLSKAYAMTGWRIGYMAAPTHIAKVVGNIQSHSTSNPNTIAQIAGITALSDCADEVEDMRCSFHRRRDLMLQNLEMINAISFSKPSGAFYIMINIETYLGRRFKDELLENSTDFCLHLLDHYKVAAVPGLAFGDEGTIRLSYAIDDVSIVEGVNRLKEFLKQIH